MTNSATSTTSQITTTCPAENTALVRGNDPSISARPSSEPHVHLEPTQITQQREKRSNHRQSIAFNGILKQTGLPHMRFHDLRHSAATILLSRGTHPKVVQEILGHSQISMTLDVYSHVLPVMQEDVRKGWGDDFGGAAVPVPVK